jgi:predicted transcriptional regulator
MVYIMGKNRDRLSIVAAILEAANPGTSKTRIMFSANLSYSLLEKYLNIADRAGFLQTRGSKYHLTEHGQEFLREYKHFHERYYKAQRLLDSLGSERERLASLFDKNGLNESDKSELDVE